MHWEKDGFTVSAQKDDVDIDILHDLLKRSYWAHARTRDEVEASIDNSTCFSLYNKCGFAEMKSLKFLSRNWQM